MKHVITIAAAVALCGAGSAQAGIGRSDQSVGILFEPGNYAQFSLGGFNRNISGNEYIDDDKYTISDISPGYGTYSLGYKQALSDRLDLAIILDQPIGAKVKYPADEDGNLYGSTGRIKLDAVTGLLRYKLPKNLSVYGGLRIESASIKAYLPYASDFHHLFEDYTLDTSREESTGYVIGVGWEQPEIGARVALTYNSKIDFDFMATEWGKTPKQLVALSEIPDKPGVNTNSFTTTVPESVNLEFQTGIAPDTLLMGSVRWVHWTQFDITPPAYSAAFKHYCTTEYCKKKYKKGVPIASYKHNSTTWKIGLGHRFSDQWSGTVIFGYEPHEGTSANLLDPTDGFKSVALAASYQASDRITITGDISYVNIGDSSFSKEFLDTDGRFSGNSGFGAGLRVGIRF